MEEGLRAVPCRWARQTALCDCRHEDTVANDVGGVGQEPFGRQVMMGLLITEEATKKADLWENAWPHRRHEKTAEKLRSGRNLFTGKKQSGVYSEPIYSEQARCNW